MVGSVRWFDSNVPCLSSGSKIRLAAGTDGVPWARSRPPGRHAGMEQDFFSVTHAQSGALFCLQEIEQLLFNPLI